MCNIAEVAPIATDALIIALQSIITCDRCGRKITSSTMTVGRAKGLAHAINGNATKTEIKEIFQGRGAFCSLRLPKISHNPGIRHLTRVVIPSRTALGVILGSSGSEIKNGTRNKSVATERRCQAHRVGSALFGRKKRKGEEKKTPEVRAATTTVVSSSPLLR